MGNEAQVEQQSRGFASAGAAGFLFQVGQDTDASFSWSWEPVRRPVGKI